MSDRYANVETTLGIVRAFFIDRDQVYASSGPLSGVPPLTVNGVEYGCIVRLFRDDDGIFALSDYRGISGSRVRSVGNHRKDELTDDARRQVERVVVPALQLWARGNPRLMYEAEAEASRSRIEDYGRRIAEHQREIGGLAAAQQTWAIRLDEAEAALALSDNELMDAVRTGAGEEQA